MRFGPWSYSHEVSGVRVTEPRVTRVRVSEPSRLWKSTKSKQFPRLRAFAYGETRDHWHSLEGAAGGRAGATQGRGSMGPLTTMVASGPMVPPAPVERFLGKAR